MRRGNKALCLGFLGVMMLVSAGTAMAQEREPVLRKRARTSSLTVERYRQPVVVERLRSQGKHVAIFHADPQLIDPSAVAIFEIRSVGPLGNLARWRCIAVNDVAECLGLPVRIRYLPDDVKVVLTMRLEPRVVLEELAGSDSSWSVLARSSAEATKR